VSHRFDPCGVNPAHLVYQAEDAVQSFEHRFEFLGADSDAG
jgi:hypothetical protein